LDQATDFLAVTPAASYDAPWWLPGGHLQTIYPAVLIPKPAVRYQRERWQTPDNDFIDVDFAMQPRVMEAENPSQAAQPHAPFVLLFHGLEGSSDSHYARALMAGVQQYGWNGAVVHFRGCSGTFNLTPRFYHSGDVEEIDWVIRRFKQHALVQDASKLYVVGVSLGGNVLLRWLGESQHQAEIVDGACAVSAPMDLSAGGAALSSGLNLIYTQRFLATLKPKCLQKLDQFPGLFDRERMLNA
jgi:predicted alpha/beta-fold hydrolase